MSELAKLAEILIFEDAFKTGGSLVNASSLIESLLSQFPDLQREEVRRVVVETVARLGYRGDTP